MDEISLATSVSEIRKVPNLGIPSSCCRREKTPQIICGTLLTKVVLCISHDLVCTSDTVLQILNTETFKSVDDVDLYDDVRKFIFKKHHSEA